MDYMEVFLKCIEGDIDTSKASEIIRQQADALLLSGEIKEYEKAVLCLTYFIRYRQYNTGKISGDDLMLFLRDFVFYVGRVRFPRLIQDAVRREGSKIGLFVAGDGAVDGAARVRGPRRPAALPRVGLGQPGGGECGVGARLESAEKAGEAGGPRLHPVPAGGRLCAGGGAMIYRLRRKAGEKTSL